jgi:AhpD family alkylhydroperoxidase
MPRLPYPKLAPEPYAHMTALGHYLNTATTLDPILIELVRLRASILNRCNFCTGMHAAELRKHHEPDSRIEAIAHWQDTDA